MRHRRTVKKLKRTAEHRKATLAALCTALFEHKKISTTVVKAKVTRSIAERLITKAKRALKKEAESNVKDVHARREVFAALGSRKAVTALFNDIAPRVAERRGGYTRVVRVNRRHGDAAEVALLELIDFGAESAQKSAKKAEAKAARKAKKAAAAKAAEEAQAAQAAEPQPEAPAAPEQEKSKE